MTSTLGKAAGALRALRTAAIAMAAILFATVAGAQPHTENTRFIAWSQLVETAEARLSDPTLSDFTVDHWVSELEALIVDARDAAAKARGQSAPFQSQLAALGPPPEDGTSEAKDLAEERSSLQSRIAGFDADARRAEALIARAEQTLSQLREWRRRAFAERLTTRSASPLAPDTLSKAYEDIRDAFARGESHHFDLIERLKEAGLLRTAVIGLAMGLGLAIVLIFFLRKVVILRLMRLVAADSGEMRKLLVAIGLTAARLAIPMAAIGVLQISLQQFSEFGVGDLSVLRAGVRGAALIVVVYALAYAYYAPGKPALRLADIEDAKASAAAYWALIIAAFVAVDVILVAFGDLHALGEAAMSVLNVGVVSAAAFGFWRFIAVHRETAADRARAKAAAAQPEAAPDAEPDEKAGPSEMESIEVILSRLARVFTIAAAALAPLAAVAGFYALSRYVIANTILTTALFGVCTLLYTVVRNGVDALAESAGAATKGEERPADFALTPVVFGSFLALAAVPVVALIWGVTVDDLMTVYRSIANGIRIGDFTFSPLDILVFAIVLVIGVIATRTVQSILRGTILPRTRMDEGARASIVSGVGYLGFPLAALAAVGAAGLDLSNIAIVAGALSVGIGFGLQNVVNNFVSGVILLIERPVKIGDWIVVGGEHGIVRKINVRSTEIQTFDRTTLIVPNSELISSTVTNYTHNDLMGRLIVPIGVAYGTDPRKVERILGEIARSSPYARRTPAPQVFFMNFGDNSLDFEIRIFLRNVNEVLLARSAINFEIARRFTDAGVEIPFPQRDIHLRDIDRLAAAIRGEAEPKAD